MAPTLNGLLTLTLFQGAPGPLSLIFANQFKRAPYIIFNWPPIKWAPNSSIDLGGPGPLNLIFVNQFKNAPEYNNI